MCEKCRGNYYITTPIYYPSAKLHIGHAYCTVATDTMARFKRLQGYNVMFLTGTDEHGQKIEDKAKAAGVTPQQFVDNIVTGERGVLDLWKLMNISYDRFIRTTDDYHVAAIQRIFKRMHDNGDIYKGVYKGKYCKPCESFWTESQLKDGKCPDCGREVQDAEEEAYFFRLSKYADRVQDLLENTDFLEPRSRVNEMVNNFIKPGLEDLCVSRTSFTWGVPVDFDPGHVVYVWIDALFNYMTALGFENDKYHDLEDFWPEYWNNWRMDYNHLHRGDVYATHGMGPACQVLNIHRGDRMKTLVSMDTKAVNGPAYIKKQTGEEVTDFQNGDQTSTLIRTENGKTMLIQHNVMTPRPYSRMYQIVGADGYASKYPIEEYCLRPSQVDSKDVPNHENLNAHGSVPENVKKALMDKYKDPIHIELEETAKKVGGHGGMDFIMDYRLAYCLQNGLPLDMDVYDLAEWCCMAELTRLSIENNSAPVEVPDFTRGGWNKVQGYRHAFAK